MDDLTPHDELSISQTWKNFDATFDKLAPRQCRREESFRITDGVSYSEFELVSILNPLKCVSFDEGWRRWKVVRWEIGKAYGFAHL